MSTKVQAEAATGSPAARSRRRWFQFRLGTLLFAVTLICVWLSNYVDPVRRLERQLRDSSEQVRAAAAYDLGAMGQVAKRAEASLFVALAEESPVVRAAAALAVSRIGGDLKALPPLLLDPNDEVRLAAAESILWGGGDLEPAIAALIRLSLAKSPLSVSGTSLLESDVEDLVKALSAEMAARAIVPIFQALADEDVLVADAASDVLRSLPVPAASATQPSIEFLDHPKMMVRVAAAEQLLRLGRIASSAEEPLRRRVDDDDPEMADMAAAALMAVSTNNDDALAQLSRGLASGDGTRVRRCANHIAQLGPLAAQAVVPLLTLLRGATDDSADDAARALEAIGPVNVSAVADIVAGSVAPSSRQRAIQVLASYGAQAGDAVRALRSACDDPYAEVREAAARAMAAIGKDAAPCVDRLVDLLGDETVDVRDSAADALAAIGLLDESEIRILTEHLQSNDPHVQLRSAKVLANCDATTDSLLLVLRELLGATDPKVVDDAMRISERLGPEASPVIDRLIRLLASHSAISNGFGGHSICQTAAQALGALGPEAVGNLIEQLSHADPQVRGLAAQALGLIGPPAKDAVPYLCRLLDDRGERECSSGCMVSRTQVRDDVIDALGRIGPAANSAVARLASILSEPTCDPAIVQMHAVEALGRIGPDARSAVPDILRLNRSDLPDLPQTVAVAMARIAPDNPVTLRLLSRALTEIEQNTVAELAYGFDELSESLVGLGPRAAPLIPQLRRMTYTAPLIAPFHRYYAAYSLTAFSDERDQAMGYLQRAATIPDSYDAWLVKELLLKAR